MFWFGLSSFNAILDLFYPHCCYSCGKSLDNHNVFLCPTCEQKLVRTEMATIRQNSVEMHFWDDKKFIRGAAFGFYGRDAVLRHLIQELKYANRPQIGVYLGTLAAQEFNKQHFFEDIDIIVPVPLHKRRLYQRSYNQAEKIAEGISAVTNIPIDTTHLYRKHNNTTQTRKNREEREANTQDLFAIHNPNDWKNKHILLVDDIVTTGATLQSCIHAFHSIRNIKYSVFAIGQAGK